MKKLFLPAFLLLACITLFLQGCIKDTFTTTYSYTMFTPVYKTKADVRNEIQSAAPRQLENTGKLYMFGNYVFLNELNKGIHVINNTDPANPVNLGFIAIPGNVDLAVKGNFLYADLYTDLVVLDISNPASVKLSTLVENVFPHRYYDTYFTADTSKIIVDWIQKDTTVTTKGTIGRWWDKSVIVFESGPRFDFSLSNRGNMAAAAPSPAGMGGSMARFALAKDMLYTVGTHDLKSFNIATPDKPVYASTQNIGWDIETIFPFRNNLFIGSRTGMYIFDISNPAHPVQKSMFTHVRSCDPVIADEKFAYVTLRSGTACLGFTNQLEVLDIANLANPQLLKTYQLTNPHGLSKDGDYLFICDGKDGLKIYDAKNVNNLQLVKTISGIETYDVIAWNHVALVVAKDGLYQYDYSNINDVRLLSKISLKN